MTSVLMSAPTLDEVKEWRDTVLTSWDVSIDDEGGLASQVKDEVDLYFQKFKVRAPREQWVVKTGSAPSDVDAAIDTLVPQDITVRVRPARIGQKYVDQAEKQGRWARAVLAAWRENKDVLRDIVSDMVIKRVGVGRVVVDDTLWANRPTDWDTLSEEEQADWEIVNRSHTPIVLERRNPDYVRWQDDNAGNLTVVVERYESTVLDARMAYDRFPAAKKYLKEKTLRDKITIDDVWVGSYRCILLDMHYPVFPGKGVMRHGYGLVPYVISPFRELPFEEVGRRYRGMLSNSASLYQIESEVLTMEAWMLAWNAWRTFIGHTKDKRPIEIVPGQMIEIDERMGEYLKLLEGDPVPDELLKFAGTIDGMIQRNGVAQGPRSVDGTRSGQQVWAIQAMRQVKLESAKQSLIRLVRRSLYLASMMVENCVKDPITLPVPGRDREGKELGEVTIRPSDFKGYWNGFQVTLGQRWDPAVLEQAKQFMFLAANGWMPYIASVEASGLTDSAYEWRDDLLRQGVDNLPFMKEMAGLEQIKEFYGADSMEYRLLSMRLMQQQQSGQTGGGQTNALGSQGMQPSNGAVTQGSGDTAAAQTGGSPSNIGTGGM